MLRIRDAAAKKASSGRFLEGCCLPVDWQKDFAAHMSRSCIGNHFGDITAQGNAIEHHLDGSPGKETLIREMDAAVY